MRRKSPTNCGTITFPRVHSTLMALPGLAVKISPNSANGLTLESCYLSTNDPGVILPIWKSHRKGLDLPSRGAVKEYLKKISMLVAPRLTYPNPYKSYWRRWAPAVPGRSSILGAQMVSYWLTRLGGGGHQLEASSAIRIYKRSIRASSAISSPNSGNLVRFNKIAASILFTLVCNVANACNTRLDWSFTVLYEKGIFCDRACSQNWYISASEHKINPINLTFVQDVDFFLTKKKYFEGDTRVSHNTHFFELSYALLTSHANGLEEATKKISAL